MDNYIEQALRTESPVESGVLQRLQDAKTVRLLHAAMGLCTESGEIQNNLKRHIFYGKSLDFLNLFEEGGDMFWYLAILANAIGEETFDRLMSSNIAKLRVRYPERFTSQNALERNTGAELEALQKTEGASA